MLSFNHNNKARGFNTMAPEFSNDYYAYLLRINSADNNPITQEYIDLLIRCKQLNVINHAGVDSGMTALHRAVLMGNIKKVQWLRSAGADVNLRCNPPRNQTALDLAYSIKDKIIQEDIVRLLQKAPESFSDLATFI